MSYAANIDPYFRHGLECIFGKERKRDISLLGLRSDRLRLCSSSEGAKFRQRLGVGENKVLRNQAQGLWYRYCMIGRIQMLRDRA